MNQNDVLCAKPSDAGWPQSSGAYKETDNVSVGISAPSTIWTYATLAKVFRKTNPTIRSRPSNVRSPLAPPSILSLGVYGWVRVNVRRETNDSIRARWAKIVVAWSTTLFCGNLLNMSTHRTDSRNICVIWTPAKAATRYQSLHPAEES